MFADPKTIVRQFDLRTGMQVADLGTGSGFYALESARIVGSKGKVYAIEVQKDLLDRVKNNASREGLHNIEVVWGDIEQEGGTRLRDESVDRAIVSNTLFQIEDKERFVREVKRILRHDGKVFVIDWSDSSDVSGPNRAHIVGKAEAQALFEREGFAFDREISAGAHHYGLIMTKK